MGLALSAVLIAGALIVAPAQAQSNEEKPYTISDDGKVDWYTFSGFRRYHAECHVCHGPDGLGSSFAPSLVESLKTVTYDEFFEVVVNGRENVGTTAQNKMPAFGENKNVMCFLDDIYAYLKARTDGVLDRGRPDKEAKPEEATERDNACLS
jgi:methanol metabolism-related c-type cytochrome